MGLLPSHAAIGTAAIGRALNALASHVRAGPVRWCGAKVFVGADVLGAALGAGMCKAVDRFLTFSRLLIIGSEAAMLHRAKACCAPIYA